MTEEDIKTNFHNEKIIKPSCCLTAAFETNKLKQTFFPPLLLRVSESAH